METNDPKPPETPDDQETPENDVPNGTNGSAAVQVPGSHAERMLAMLVPAIKLVIENVDDKNQAKVLDELRNFANPSRWVYRAVVWFLGLTALVTVFGVAWLGLCGKAEEIPNGLVALGSASIGALAGLLANRAN